MSTSKNNKTIKTATVYLGISIFCAFFGAVYEHFGHGVYSNYMIYAFAIPLVFGSFVFLMIDLCGKPYPNQLSHNLYGAGIAALTVGSIMKGILDIYGTTNKLTIIYLIAGVVLILNGAIDYIVNINADKN